MKKLAIIIIREERLELVRIRSRLQTKHMRSLLFAVATLAFFSILHPCGKQLQRAES